MTASPRWHRLVRRTAWGLLAGLSVLLVWLAVAQYRRERAADEHSRSEARRWAVDAAKAIDGVLNQVKLTANALANDLSAGRLAPADLPARLAKDLAAEPDLVTFGVAYAPFALGPGVRLVAPHVIRRTDRIEPMRLEESYADYSKEPWFAEAMRGAIWGEPHFGQASQRTIVGYDVPVFRPGDPAHTPIGIVRASFSTENIRDLVARVSVGQEGYAFLTSAKGVLLAHPLEDLVRRQVNLFDAIRGRDHIRAAAVQRALRGEEVQTNATNLVTGQKTFQVMVPVPTAGWALGVIDFENEVDLGTTVLRRTRVALVTCAVAWVSVLGLVVFRIDRDSHRALWQQALTAAGAMLIGICAIWVLTLYYPDRNGENSVQIFDHGALNKFLTNQAGPVPMKAVIDLPTGVMVQTMRFVDANDIVVSGTIWQRVPPDRPTDLRLGIDLPDGEAVEFKEGGTISEGPDQVVSWGFRATLRLPSVWSAKYPFDRALVRLRMLPKVSARPVRLVPDLAAYQIIAPSGLPGVSRDLVLPGWALDHSYFSYLPEAAQTSSTAAALENPVLPYDFSFNVVAQRRFLDAFISSVLPIVVIVCLLFGLLMVGSKVATRVAATGFKATDILRASVTLLFPALVAQVNLRNKIGGNEVIYIEYFYFIVYIAILAVSANALTFTLGAKGVSQVRDNLVPKVLYWPVLMAACLSITLAFLY